jgi:hypothetical protein
MSDIAILMSSHAQMSTVCKMSLRRLQCEASVRDDTVNWLSGDKLVTMCTEVPCKLHAGSTDKVKCGRGLGKLHAQVAGTFTYLQSWLSQCWQGLAQWCAL